ncbi:MAG TPA: aminotransferase class III-fold pyridoxal phosphate-dependent enzyme, partial [Victivallales bacterium]|nr:aminotransferase class III-fold pyridoxal phosphate-dependent enzyme [Victivallales bacterium]
MSMDKAPKNNVFYRNQNWYYPKITHGKGIYLYDENGKEYIDGCSGSSVANIGHGNEEVAEVAATQIKTVAFSHLSRFTTNAIENCCKEVADLTPGDVNHSYLVSGGSEATESAIKLARQYFVERDINTSKWKIISRWKSFHGNTMGSLSMTGITGRRKIYDPILINFPKINQAYCYRCPYKTYPDKCSFECAYELENQITQTGPENISAFIAEPVIGSAVPGANPPKEYFKIIR